MIDDEFRGLRLSLNAGLYNTVRTCGRRFNDKRALLIHGHTFM